MKASAAIVAGIIIGLSACAATTFDQRLRARDWDGAAAAFAADSTLARQPHALVAAATLFASPELDLYDPGRAQALFVRAETLSRGGRLTGPAGRLAALVDDLVRRDSLRLVREHMLTDDLAQRQVEAETLRARLARLTADSATNDSLRMQLMRTSNQLTADLHDRDDQIRALQLELAQLKEIDFAPLKRPPFTP